MWRIRNRSAKAIAFAFWPTLRSFAERSMNIGRKHDRQRLPVKAPTADRSLQLGRTMAHNTASMERRSPGRSSILCTSAQEAKEINKGNDAFRVVRQRRDYGGVGHCPCWRSSHCFPAPGCPSSAGAFSRNACPRFRSCSISSMLRASASASTSPILMRTLRP